jgi:hypothetical protein
VHVCSEKCERYVPAGGPDPRPGRGYRTAKKRREKTTGLLATEYDHGDYTNMEFLGERAAERADNYATCNGGTYNSEPRGSGKNREVVRFDH